jgi:polar amino acid transport system substrate-binding protein
MLLPLRLALLACLACADASALAGCSRAITVPVSPMGSDIIIDEQHKVTGVLPELLAELTARTGCRFTLLPVPRMRALSMFADGKVDLLPAVVQTAERDKAGQFIAFTSARVAAVGLRDKAIMVDEQLDGSYSVNVVRGYDYGPAYLALLDKLRRQHRLEEVVDPLTAVRKLSMGRAGLVLIAPGALVDAVMQTGMDQQLQARPLTTIPPFLAGIYLARHGLPEPDRQLLATALAEPSLQQKYWRLISTRLPAWALEGAKPAR